MSIQVKKINNIEIEPIKFLEQTDNRPIMGSAITEIKYPNWFLLARKNSGKTTVINHLLRARCDKYTHIIFFVSTINKDPSYTAIINYLDQNHIQHTDYESLFDANGDCILDNIIKSLQEKAAEEKKDAELAKKLKTQPKKLKVILCDDESDEESDEKQERNKRKYISPDYCIVLDDLSDEIASKAVATLLAKNRHYRMQVILSSQYIHHISTKMWMQIDVALIFKGESHLKIKSMYDKMNLNISYDELQQIYDLATQEDHSFLYIDRTSNLFRIGFSQELKISKS